MTNDNRSDQTPESEAKGYTGERGPGQKLLGEILLEEGFLTPQDLVRLVHHQRTLGPGERQPIGRLAVELGFLSETQLRHLLDRHGKRLSLGELLVSRGAISREQVARALETQAEDGGLLGEILVEQGALDEITLAITLAEQADLAYVPLGADDPLEPELARWVNRAYAWRHGVVPVGRLGRRLTVALWHPASLPYCDELGRATGYVVRPVLSTRSQVHARLTDLYGPFQDTRPETAKGAKVIALDPQIKSLPEEPGSAAAAAAQASAPSREDERGASLIVNLPLEAARTSTDAATGETSRPGSASTPAADAAAPLLFDLLSGLGLAQGEVKSLRTLMRQGEGSLLVVGPPGSGVGANYDRFLHYAQGAGEGPAAGADRLVEGVSELTDFRAIERFLRPRHARVFRIAYLEADHSTAAWGKLVDLGAPPDRASGQLTAALAMVGIRLTCDACLESYEPRPIVLSEWFGPKPPETPWRRGRGCEHCGHSGYRADGYVSELWMPNEAERRLMSEGTSLRRLREECLPRIEGLGARGLTMALAGRTTLEELLQRMPAEEVRTVRLERVAQKQQRKAS